MALPGSQTCVKVECQEAVLERRGFAEMDVAKAMKDLYPLNKLLYLSRSKRLQE